MSPPASAGPAIRLACIPTESSAIPLVTFASANQIMHSRPSGRHIEGPAQPTREHDYVRMPEHEHIGNQQKGHESAGHQVEYLCAPVAGYGGSSGLPARRRTLRTREAETSRRNRPARHRTGIRSSPVSTRPGTSSASIGRCMRRNWLARAAGSPDS